MAEKLKACCYQSCKAWGGQTLWVSVSEQRNENTAMTHIIHLKTQHGSADKSLLILSHLTERGDKREEGVGKSAPAAERWTLYGGKLIINPVRTRQQQQQAELIQHMSHVQL